VKILSGYVDIRLLYRGKQKKERERKVLSLFQFKEEKRVKEEEAVIRAEKERHIIYQDRTKRIQFNSNQHNNIINYC
jgi:hypothetical protein